MLINFVDATNDANHYTKPPLKQGLLYAELAVSSPAVVQALISPAHAGHHR